MSKLPLPEPAIESYQCDSVMRTYALHTFTAEQMTAHAAAARAQALEEAALACENERVEATGEPEDKAYNWATEHCADAIRELKDKP